MVYSNNILRDNQDFDKYEVLSLLGRGGMGEVYRVQHRVLKQEYAVKMLLPDFTGRTGRELFEEEARIMAELGQASPYIVKVDDFGNTDNSYWLRMELANGFNGCITLADLMRNAEGQQMPVEPELFRLLFFHILSAMAEAHKTVVHRDLKPSNILLFTDREANVSARVSDFGLVSIVGEESFVEQSHKSMQQSLSFGTDKSAGDSSGTGKSAEGLVGTWEYMSPEQQDRQPATVQSDIYSLGLIAFRALTGKKKPGFRAPSKQIKGLPDFWDDLVMTALEEDIADRFSSVQEMLDLISDFAVSFCSKNIYPGQALFPILTMPSAPKPAGRGFLDIKTDPPGFKVILSGSSNIMKSPARIELDSGNYELVLEKSGWDSLSRRVDINADQTTNLDLQMPALMSIETEPAGADIYINNQGPFLSPMKEHRVSGGTASLKITADGYEDFCESVDLQSSFKKRVVLRKLLYTGKVQTFDGIEFVYIEPGEFNMGSEDYNGEGPVHKVKISRGFWLSKYPVTQGQWKSVMGNGNNPSNFQNGDNYPVENVSWDDNAEYGVQTFIKKLNKKSCGKELDSEQVWHDKAAECYRLPTEAEWEYACRAGTKTAYSWGDDDSSAHLYANLADITLQRDNSPLAKALVKAFSDNNWSFHQKSDGYAFTSPVGNYRPNKWGLYDMHGNVWEWVLDWYDEDYYGECGSACTDPANLTVGSARVRRGGSWGGSAGYLRSARRDWCGPGSRDADLGFRLVRSVRR